MCNLSSALLNTNIIQQKLHDKLLAGHVNPMTLIIPFISSLLGLVPKSNREISRIYHLLFLYGSLVNDYILKKAANLKYTILENILKWICQAGQSVTIIKIDIKDVFRIIPIVPY